MAPAFFAICFATASSMLTVSFLEESQSSRMPLVLLVRYFGCIKWGQSKESRQSKAAGAKPYPNAKMAKRVSQIVYACKARACHQDTLPLSESILAPLLRCGGLVDLGRDARISKLHGVLDEQVQRAVSSVLQPRQLVRQRACFLHLKPIVDPGVPSARLSRGCQRQRPSHAAHDRLRNLPPVFVPRDLWLRDGECIQSGRRNIIPPPIIKQHIRELLTRVLLHVVQVYRVPDRNIKPH